jgi:hypothetical protein
LPLAVRRLELGGGGGGTGSGLPLAARTLELGGGGGGTGSGLPLRGAEETDVVGLLDNCLTELLTGSTIETAKARNAKRILICFIMVEPSWFNHEVELDELVAIV